MNATNELQLDAEPASIPLVQMMGRYYNSC